MRGAAEAIDPAELARDAAASAVPNDHALAEVAALAESQVELEARIAAAETRLEVLRAEHHRLAGQLLPEAMRALGLTTLKLVSGEKVDVKPILRASIPAEHRDAALAWLDAHGFGDLVKHDVSASFGKGEDAEARLFLELAVARGVPVEDRRTVHPQTLAAFVREQDDAGAELPEQLLGVFRADVAKITRPRAK